MSVKFKCGISMLLLVVSGPVVTAQERVWTKSRAAVEMDVRYAEYTSINTVDGLSPRLARFLYEDSFDGALLVIRKTAEFQANPNGKPDLSTSEWRISSVNTNDQVVVHLDEQRNVTVTFGQASLSWADQSPIPQSIQDEAFQLFIASTSSDFRQALIRLVKNGSYYWPRMRAASNLLRKLLFPALQDQPAANYEMSLEGTVENFKPNEVPPDEFDARFGNAYYE